jgi:hypothetical protein
MSEVAPIADLDAEGAILGTALVAPECVGDLQGQVNIEDFFSVPNQLTWRAIVACHATGTCSINGVRSFLVQHNRGDQVPLAYLASLTLAAVHPSKASHAVIAVKARARQRKLVAIGQHVAAMASLPDSDLGALTTEMSAVLANDNDGRKPIDMWPASIPIADYYRPLPDVRWVCRDLCICPGRPAMLAGYGFSGKTIAALSLAVQVATGRAAFGQFPTRRTGRVYHLDHEQGTHGTRRRIQRILLANGIHEGELEGFEVKVFPSANLTTHGFEEFLKRALDGASLCSFDSLRAITPGIDENDSKIREYLDILTRVSEKTGCAMLVIHHDGKGGKDKEGRETMRGSSAIFDACGTVLSFSAKEGEPIKVSAKKTAAEAEGAPFEPFFLRIEDVPDPSNPSKTHWGLRMSYMTSEQVNPPTSPQAIEKREDCAVLEYLMRNDGASTVELEQSLRPMKRSSVRGALERLLRTGRVECRTEAHNTKRWRLRGSYE